MVGLRDILFQFRGDQVALSDDVRFDARGTAHAEGWGVGCVCLEGRDGAVAAVLGGGVVRAEVGGLEFAAMAAGGEGGEVSVTHGGCGCGCGCEVL